MDIHQAWKAAFHSVDVLSQLPPESPAQREEFARWMRAQEIRDLTPPFGMLVTGVAVIGAGWWFALRTCHERLVSTVVAVSLALVHCVAFAVIADYRYHGIPVGGPIDRYTDHFTRNYFGATAFVVGWGLAAASLVLDGYLAMRMVYLLSGTRPLTSGPPRPGTLSLPASALLQGKGWFVWMFGAFVLATRGCC